MRVRFATKKVRVRVRVVEFRSYLVTQAELLDDVDLEKHLENDLTSVQVVEVGVDEVEVEQSVVVRRLQVRHLQQVTRREKVKFSHTRYRALGPELIPVYRQSARR